MAFDRIFQGSPANTQAPGSHQNPSLGVDIVDKTLYISAGNGWEQISSTGAVINSFIMQDTANGHTYQITMTNGVLSQTQIS